MDLFDIRSELSDEERMVQGSVGRFVDDKVIPVIRDAFENHYFPKDLVPQIAGLGLLGSTINGYDCAGLNSVCYGLICQELERGDSAIRSFVSVQSSLVMFPIHAYGSDEQKDRWLPAMARGEAIGCFGLTEAQGGSDPGNMKTHAKRDGDDWILNGSKTFISNGINGGAFIVAARTVPDNRHGIGLFVVESDMEGFSRGRNLKKMGLKTQDTAELFFENVRVPAENVLGDPERGFYHLMHHLAEERLISACQEVVHAQVAFDLTMEYILERKAFGKPIGAFQNSRFKMAEMRTSLDVLQTFVDQCVLLHLKGELTAELAAEAKLSASELESKVMDRCVQLHGGAGYMSEYRISHMFTDARVSRIYAGSSEIMKEIIARSIGLDERKLSN